MFRRRLSKFLGQAKFSTPWLEYYGPMELRRVEVYSDFIRVYTTYDIPLHVIYLEDTEGGLRDFMEDNHFTLIIPSWEGYGYARNIVGWWFEVDLRKKKVLKRLEKIPRMFFLEKVVTPEFYSPDIENVKLVIKEPLYRK